MKKSYCNKNIHGADMASNVGAQDSVPLQINADVAHRTDVAMQRPYNSCIGTSS